MPNRRFDLPARLKRDPEWLRQMEYAAARETLTTADGRDLVHAVLVLNAELQAAHEAFYQHFAATPSAEQGPIADDVVEWVAAKFGRIAKLMQRLSLGERRETREAADELRQMPWHVLAFLGPAVRRVMQHRMAFGPVCGAAFEAILAAPKDEP